MRALFLLAALALVPVQSAAQEAGQAGADAIEEAVGTDAFAPVPANGVDLVEFQWQLRPLVVFANSPADPAFSEQMRLIEALWFELAARDVVVITDTDPAAMSAVRRKLRPRGFMLVLIGKDGNVVLRKPFPWDVRELTRAIDKLPIRQEELRLKRLVPQ